MKWIEHLIGIDDNLEMLARDFYIKQKEREREQDSGETQRVWVREAECCWERKIASAIK
jgi:hypothetical protein